MPKQSQRPPSPITAAVAVDLSAAIARDLPFLPRYDPAVEVTARDLSERNGVNRNTVKMALEKLVKDGTWTSREVMAGARRATAYRPKVK